MGPGTEASVGTEAISHLEPFGHRVIAPDRHCGGHEKGYRHRKKGKTKEVRISPGGDTLKLQELKTEIPK